MWKIRELENKKTSSFFYVFKLLILSFVHSCDTFPDDVELDIVHLATILFFSLFINVRLPILG